MRLCAEWLAVGVVAALVAGCGGGGSSSGGGGGTGGGNGGGGGTATTVTVNFKGQTPTAVATQVGTGAFATVTPAATVTLSLPSGTTKFAVAYVCPAVTLTVGMALSQVTNQNVLEATTRDGTSFNAVCGAASGSGTTGVLTFSVDASAITGASEVSVQAENSQYYAQAPFGVTTTGATLNAPAGTDRVDIQTYNISGSGAGYVLATSAVKSFTGQAVPGALNGGNPVVLGAEDLVTTQPVTFNGLPVGYGTPFVVADFLPSGVAAGLLLTDGQSNNYSVPPASVTQGGGMYDVQVEAIATPNATGAVSVLQRFATAGPVTVNFPVAWSYAGPTAAANPTFDFSSYTGFAGKSGVSQTGEISWQTGTGAQSTYTVKASASYQGSSSTVTLPNLSGLTGFLPQPASGTSLAWAAAELQSDAGTIQSASGAATVNTVLAQGSFTMP